LKVLLNNINIELVSLEQKYKQQFVDMLSEWSEYNQSHPEANTTPYAIFKNDYRDFDFYLKNLNDDGKQKGLVPSVTFFALDKDRNIFVGAVNIRLYLNPHLLKYGGHIGDGVRPSERKKGFATEIIRLALIKCREYKIKKVLMTCNEDNIGSRKSILNNGGVFESVEVEDGINVERYWLDTNLKICQSCSMPIFSSEDLAVNSDGNKNQDYCKYCLKDNHFIHEVSLEKYIEMNVEFASQAGMTKDEMRKHCQTVFPLLKRWRKEELRLATKDEISLLTKISKEAFNSDYLLGGEPNDGPPSYDDEKWHLDLFLENKLYSFLVNGNVIGGAVIFSNLSEVYIGRIFIKPELFGYGLGESLMLMIEKAFPDASKFKLDTPVFNIRTNSLYKKLRYKEVSRIDDQIAYEKNRQ